MIDGRYTLFSRIPLYEDEGGRLLAGQLWALDLDLHTLHRRDFHICCPLLPAATADTPLTPLRTITRDRVHAIPHNVGWGAVLKNLLPTGRRVLAAARASDLIHSGGAGWPFPLSFYLLAGRRRIPAIWIMVIESSFWRLEPGERGTLRQRAVHAIWSRLLPACLKAADIRIFTQSDYRRTLYDGDGPCLVSPAVWTEAQQLETEEGLAARQAQAEGVPLRVIFPARLVPEKGVATVIAAADRLEEMLGTEGKVALRLDLMGEGPLAQTCRDAAAAPREGRVRLGWRDPVPYGDAFTGVLRGYDALVVANLKAEQPRILFDAMAQGLTVVTSATPGTLDIVTPDRTGLVFDPGDAEGLARALLRLIEAPDERRALARAGLAHAQGYTHEGMHETFCSFIATEVARLDQGSAG